MHGQFDRLAIGAERRRANPIQATKPEFLDRAAHILLIARSLSTKTNDAV
jgi:hypothetical protein